MWTNWMEASIWVGEWQRVDTIAAQAERSIKEAEEAETVSTAYASNTIQFSVHPLLKL